MTENDEILKRVLEYAKNTNRPQMRKLTLKLSHLVDQIDAASRNKDKQKVYELINEEVKLISEIISKEFDYLYGKDNNAND